MKKRKIRAAIYTFGLLYHNTKKFGRKCQRALNPAYVLPSQLCVQVWVASFWRGHLFLILMKVTYGLVVYLKTLALQCCYNHKE